MIIGLGNQPAAYNGALMADLAVDGTVTAEYTLDEQGVMDTLLLPDGTLFVCGCDAALGDDWTMGNVYTRSPAGVWTKKRTLTNVIHVWGACLHGGDIYCATGAHIGDNSTWEARCFITSDLGDTWTSHYVCYYRIYDVSPYNGSLYATAWDYPAYKLYKSDNDGVDWIEVSGVTPEARIRMVEFENKLIGVNQGGASLWSINNLEEISSHPIPSEYGAVHQYSMNSLVSESGNLYVLTDSQVLKRDSMVNDWTYHCDLGTTCVSIKAYPGEFLIAGTKGDGRILKFDF